MNRHELYAGQIVFVEAPRAGTGLGKVIKVNPKNIKVLMENGSRWNMAPTFIKRAATSEEILAFEESTKSGATEKELTLGTVVQFKDNTGDREGVFVVIGFHGGSWRLAKLGGDKGRYYRGIDASSLVVVDFDLATEGV